MADEKVVVTLDARVQKYIKSLEDAKQAYDMHTQSAIKNSKDAQRFMEKSQAGQVKSTERTRKSIERALKGQIKATNSAALLQAQVTEESTDRIVAALREQSEARERSAESAEKSSERIRGAIKVVAGLFARKKALDFVKGSLQMAQSIEQQSEVIGVAIERYQELDFATDRFGISQDKMNGILEEVSGKFAEFINTGAGPLEDFFERVAPKANLTAESFKGLSSDQALGLFIKGLEDVNATEQETTFFLDALASDAKTLLPLFKNNGEALSALSGEARNLGRVLDEAAIKKAAEANRTLDQLGDTLRGNLQGAVINNADKIEEFAKTVIDAVPDIIVALEGVLGSLAKIGDLIERADDIWQASFLGQGNADRDPKTIKEAEKRLQNIGQLKSLSEQVDQNDDERNFFGRRANDLGLNIRHNNLTDERDLFGVKLFGKEQFNELKKDGEALRQAILDEYNRSGDLLRDLHIEANNLPTIELPDPLVDGAGDGEGGTGGNSSSGKSLIDPKKTKEQEAREAQIAKEVAAIEALGIDERKQIQLTLEARLESIEASKKSATEKLRLEDLAKKAALDDIALLERVEDEAAARAQAALENKRRDDFEHHQDQLSFIAEIEAAAARMSGRSLEAAEIELKAVEERYRSELAYIEQVIAAKGSTPELEAQRANAEAGLVTNQEDQQNVREDALREIDDIAGPSGQSEFEAKLEAIEEYKEQRLEALAALQTAELEMVVDFNERVKQIEDEAAQQRLQARLEQAKELLSVTQNQLSGITAALQAAGKENTKAAKIAAKAQQVIALGTAIVDTAQGVAKALGTGNIPKAIIIGALGAIQVGIIASQTFKDGGVNIAGPGTGTSDSIPARISRGESVITAAATRGNELGLQGLNDGLSPAQAFGLPTINIPTPNVSVPAFAPQSNNSFRGGDVIVQGNVDQDTLPQLQAALRERDRSFSRNVNKVMDARERRTQSRQNRVLGR